VSYITKPTVHLNGTSKEQLLADYGAAVTKLRTAIDAVANAWPHPRDYYTQGGNTIDLAIHQHQDRLKRLRSVLAELDEIREAL